MRISAAFAYIGVTPQMYGDTMTTTGQKTATGQKRHPKLVGDSSAAHILARLVDHFVGVYIPWGENTRADFIVDDGERLLRVQAKTGRLRDGAIRFPTCSSYYHHPALVRGEKYSGHRDYAGQADLFAVYCAENRTVYLVPIDAVGSREGVLRLEPTKNNQRKKIRWAQDFELVSARRSGSSMTATLFNPRLRQDQVQERRARYSVA